jgi:hypothetical protein
MRAYVRDRRLHIWVGRERRERCMQGRTSKPNHHLPYIAPRLSVVNFLRRFVVCMTSFQLDATVPTCWIVSVPPFCAADSGSQASPRVVYSITAPGMSYRTLMRD